MSTGNPPVTNSASDAVRTAMSTASGSILGMEYDPGSVDLGLKSTIDAASAHFAQLYKMESAKQSKQQAWLEQLSTQMRNQLKIEKEELPKWRLKIALQVVRDLISELNRVRQNKSGKLERELEKVSSGGKSKWAKKTNRGVRIDNELLGFDKVNNELPKGPGGSDEKKSDASPKRGQAEKQVKQKDKKAPGARKPSSKSGEGTSGTKANESSTKKEPKKQQSGSKTPKTGRKDGVFREHKTQGKSRWRVNFKDKSTREWIYALHTERTGVLVWTLEPGSFAARIKEHCDDGGYDEYLQSVGYKTTSLNFIKNRVLNYENYRDAEDIAPIDVLTLYIAQLQWLLQSNPVPISFHKWCVDGKLDEGTTEAACGFVNASSDTTRTVLAQVLCGPFLDIQNECDTDGTVTKYGRCHILPGSQLMHLSECLSAVRTFFQIPTFANNIMPKLTDMLLNEFELDEDESYDFLYQNFYDLSTPVLLGGSEKSEVNEGEHDPPVIIGNVNVWESLGFNFIPDTPEVVSDAQWQAVPAGQGHEYECGFCIPPFADDTASVTCTIVKPRVIDDFVSTTRRQPESRCVLFSVTWLDNKQHTYSKLMLNVAHVMEIVGSVSADTSDISSAIRNRLSSHHETPFTMDPAFRSAVNSDDMVLVIKALLCARSVVVPPMSHTTESRRPPRNPDPKVKIRFRGNISGNGVYLWMILHKTPRKVEVYPPTPANLELAVDKRFMNNFNYVALVFHFNHLREYLQILCSHPYRITFNLDQAFIYLNDFANRKGLTRREYANFTMKLNHLGDIWKHNQWDILLVLQHELYEETKVFVKKEVYFKKTTLRFIMSPSPYVKLIFGTVIHQIEQIMYQEHHPLYHFFIKHRSENEVAKMLDDFDRGGVPEGYVLVSNDYSSFEGSQPKPAMCLIYSYYFSFTEPNSIARGILNVLFHFCTNYSEVKNKYFTITRPPMKLSGLEDTSNSNGTLNEFNGRVCLAVGFDDMVAEGDDGAMKMKTELFDMINMLSLFPCTPAKANSIYELSFCGRKIDHHGGYILDHDQEDEFFEKMNSLFDTTEPNIQRRYDMGYLRLLSASMKYPNHPALERFRLEFNETFSSIRLNGKPLSLSTSGVRRYVRENWYRASLMQVSQLIRKRFNYPTQFPRIQAGDIDMCTTHRYPAMKLAHLLSYRASNKKELIPRISIAGMAISASTYLLTRLSFTSGLVSRLSLSGLIFSSICWIGHRIYIYSQDYLCTSSPIEYVCDYVSEAFRDRIRHSVVEIMTPAEREKLLDVKDHPLELESRLMGLNFSPSDQLMDEEKDPDLSKVLSGIDQLDPTARLERYHQALSMLDGPFCNGQRIRVFQYQLPLLYHEPLKVNFDRERHWKYPKLSSLGKDSQSSPGDASKDIDVAQDDLVHHSNDVAETNTFASQIGYLSTCIMSTLSSYYNWIKGIKLKYRVY